MDYHSYHAERTRLGRHWRAALRQRERELSPGRHRAGNRPVTRFVGRVETYPVDPRHPEYEGQRTP